MTTFGKCTCCRTRTAVTPCKVEAYADDPRAQEAMLCDPCKDGFKRAIVTPLAKPTAQIIELYQ